MGQQMHVSTRGCRCLGLLVGLALLLAVPGSGGAGQQGYAARMVTTIQGRGSVANLTIKDGKMRLQVLGGRNFSTMIFRPDRKLVWLMMPQAQQYKELPMDAMRSSVPHFFSPELRIERLRVGEEAVGGVEAVKYEARIESAEGRKYSGFLWEAKKGVRVLPLKWEDPAGGIVVEWQDLRQLEIGDAEFELPAGYRQAPKPPAGVPPTRFQGQHQPPKDGGREQPSGSTAQ